MDLVKINIYVIVINLNNQIMKKYFLLIGFVFAIITLVNAQIIPNGSFEDWTVQTLYEQPDNWTTANVQLMMMGMAANCTKSSDHYSGAFSAKLETITNGQDTISGMMIIGQPGNQTINGGYGFVDHPDTVVVHLKYNIMPNDTGHFIVFFKNVGNIVGMVGMNILGLQTGWKEFKLPVTWIQLGNPDTLSALITSSNLDSPKVPGSYVYVDGIQLIGSSTPFPNGDFENWTANTSEEPDGWATLNYAKTTVPSATKVTGFIGSHAIRVETIQTIWGQTLGYITNGQMGNNGPEGGIPVALNPSNLTGYYKYTPNGLDTAVVLVMTSRYEALMDSTIMIEMAVIKLPPVTTYTPFQVNLYYSGFPFVDTVNISFASSNLLDSNAYVGLGSALYIDSLNMNYIPLGINKVNVNYGINIFPNPVSDFVTIALNANERILSLKIFDAIGKEILKQDANASTVNTKIDVSQFKPGVYFIEVRSGDGNIYRSKFIVKR